SGRAKRRAMPAARAGSPVIAVGVSSRRWAPRSPARSAPSRWIAAAAPVSAARAPARAPAAAARAAGIAAAARRAPARATAPNAATVPTAAATIAANRRVGRSGGRDRAGRAIPDLPAQHAPSAPLGALDDV